MSTKLGPRRPAVVAIAAVVFAMAAATGSAGADPQGESAAEWRADPEEARLISETTGLTVGEAMRLIALSHHVDELRNRLADRYPERLAGVWMDIHDHGRVKVAFTRGQGVPSDALDRFPYPEVADTTEFPNAHVDLEQLKEKVSEAGSDLRGRGFQIVSVGVDVAGNVVRVGATNPQPVRAELERRYPGSPLVVVQEEEAKRADCLNRIDSCTPWRGGITLTDPVGGFQCSSAFAVTAVSSTTGLTQEALLTAGHCFAPDNRAIWHGNEVVGTAEPDREQFAGSVDGAVVLRDVGFVDPSDIAPRLFKNLDQKWWPIYSDASLSTGGVGSPICHSGITRGHQCGTITVESVDFFYGWTRFTDFRQNNICSLPGDSGGAVFHDTVAHGIINFGNFHSSGPTCDSSPWTRYTPLYYAERDLPMQIQHTP